MAVPRLIRAFMLAAPLLLLTVEAALGQAGSGSSGFGGGGGSSGGGFSGGGSSGSGSGSGDSDPLGAAIFFAVMGLIVLWMLVKSALYRAKVNRRAARVRTASAEAAEDDAWFAAEAVERDAATLFRATQEAWDARDRDRLAQLVGSVLLVEWNRRLDEFDRKGWHNRVSVLADPHVKYVGLVNRDDDDDDRVVVLLEARLRAYVEDGNGNRIKRTGESSELITLNEYWTLARRGDGWYVASIEQKSEGEHHLDSAIVASPWSDERLADEAVTELAAEDGLPAGFTTADLATLDFDGDARAHALDLSLADARFGPDVLEAAARRAVAAWAGAVDGEDDALMAVASPEAVRELLYAGDASETSRLVVRGPRVKRIRIAAVSVEREPAAMTVEVELGGRRYVEDRDTAAVLSGSRDSATTFTERWTLALDGPAGSPWRLVDTGAPAPR